MKKSELKNIIKEVLQEEELNKYCLVGEYNGEKYYLDTVLLAYLHFGKDKKYYSSLDQIQKHFNRANKSVAFEQKEGREGILMINKTKVDQDNSWKNSKTIEFKPELKTIKFKN